MPTTHSFVLGSTMSKEQKQGSSVSTVTVNDDSGTAISPPITQLIKSSVDESIGALTDNLTQVIEDRLGGFAKRFSEKNSSTVEQAIKKARQESYTCLKRKGSQQQLDHAVQVLDKFDGASDALKGKSYDKVKAALDAGPSSSASAQPNQKVFSFLQGLGPCFKISTFLYYSR